MNVNAVIERLGGPTKAAEQMGLTRQTIYNWKKAGAIPLEHALLIEEETGIERHELFPDMFAGYTRKRSRG